MYTKLCVLLLAIGMSQAVPQLVMPDLNLMQFMMQTRDLQGNPARSLECFDYYIPILNGYAETYKKEFQQCLDVAEEARLKIDDTTIESRNAINNAANGACEALTECSQLSVATEFFQCYSNQVSRILSQSFRENIIDHFPYSLGFQQLQNTVHYLGQCFGVVG